MHMTRPVLFLILFLSLSACDPLPPDPTPDLTPIPTRDMVPPTPTLLIAAQTCETVVSASYLKRPACVSNGTCTSYYATAMAKATNAVSSATAEKQTVVPDVFDCVEWLVYGFQVLRYVPPSDKAEVQRACKAMLAVVPAPGIYCTPAFLLS